MKPIDPLAVNFHINFSSDFFLKFSASAFFPIGCKKVQPRFTEPARKSIFNFFASTVFNIYRFIKISIFCNNSCNERLRFCLGRGLAVSGSFNPCFCLCRLGFRSLGLCGFGFHCFRFFSFGFRCFGFCCFGFCSTGFRWICILRRRFCI